MKTADRRYPYKPFQGEFIEPILDGRAIVSVQLLTGGRNNTNYKVGFDDDACCVLRLYSNTGSDKECYVMQLVDGLVPTPALLHKGDGFAVFSFLTGTPLAAVPEYAGAAATALSRIASVQLPTSGQIHGDGRVTPWDFGDAGDFTELMLNNAEVLRWLGTERVAEIRRIMKREAPRLAEIGAEHALVHGDFNPTNILIHDGHVSGVLDWEYALSGSPYMDIGNLLRNLPSQYHADVYRGLLAGGMALPNDWEERALLIDVSSHIEFLTSARADSFKEACVRRIDAFINRFLSSMGTVANDACQRL